jgi:hypothetical protein
MKINKISRYSFAFLCLIGLIFVALYFSTAASSQEKSRLVQDVDTVLRLRSVKVRPGKRRAAGAPNRAAFALYLRRHV